MTVSVPPFFRPPFAATAPLTALMLEAPDEKMTPLIATPPVPPLSAAPNNVSPFRNTELVVIVSEVAAEVLVRSRALAVTKLWTDCWLFASVIVGPANGVSMQTSSAAVGTRIGFQLFAFVHCPSGGTAPPVHRIVVVMGQTLVLVTVMLTEAVAFAGVGFVSFSVTVAVFMIVPVPVAMTVSETVALAPLASCPRLQVTAAGTVQVPWLGVTLSKLRLAGSRSVSVTPVELDGPLLVTVKVYVTVVPWVTVVGNAVLVIARFATSAAPGLIMMAEGVKPTWPLVISAVGLLATS